MANKNSTSTMNTNTIKLSKFLVYLIIIGSLSILFYCLYNSELLKNSVYLMADNSNITGNNVPNPILQGNPLKTVPLSKRILDYLGINLDQLLDTIFIGLFSIIKPVRVTGFIDDLIGQHIILEIILLIMLISTLGLIIAYIFNMTMYINKDYILNKFQNKYVLFYIKYQVFFLRVSLFYLPILILFGMISLIHGFVYLITHPIPYDQIGVDLHIFVNDSGYLNNDLTDIKDIKSPQ